MKFTTHRIFSFTFSVFAIATCTLWLYGISENRTVAMLISLLIWGVQTIIELGCLSILFLIYTALISENHHKDGFDILESMLVYAILLLAIGKEYTTHFKMHNNRNT